MFRQLGDQLAELSKKGQLNRLKILEDRKWAETNALQELLQGEFVFPPAEPHDIRRENLQRLLRNLVQTAVRRKGEPIEHLPDNVPGLLGVLEQASLRPDRDQVGYLPESRMRRLNHALREFLNVNYTDLEILPTENHEITEYFLVKQYQGWIKKQASRWRPSPGTAAPASGGTPDWSLRGVTSPALAEAFLTSLVEYIKPQMPEMARWLREMCGRAKTVRTPKVSHTTTVPGGADVERAGRRAQCGL